MPKKFIVTKHITDGTFAGMDIREETNVEFVVGQVITPGAWTGPGYVVTAVESAGHNET